VSGATPLVLVHGVGLDRSMWDRFAVAWRAVDETGTMLLSYDMLGLGDGPKPSGPYTLSMYIDQLAKVCAGRAVHLVGFSMGALVTQGLAACRSDQVRSLTLVSAVFDRSADERAAIRARVADVRSGGYLASVEPAIERWFTPQFVADCPEVVDAVRTRMLTNDVDAYAAAYDVFATADAELVDNVTAVKAPTLVVTGADDQRSTPIMTQRLAASLSRGRAVVVAGVRHVLPIERPDELARLVADHVARHRGPRDG
jgi:(E)-2-((N-methylformamido)methylene)succinate hydrolase